MRGRTVAIVAVVLAAALPRAAHAAPTFTVDDLVTGLDEKVRALEPTAAVRADFARLAADHGLPTDDRTRLEYLYVKIAFEATREAGWWRLSWAITNRQPQSDAIWAAWRKIGDVVPVTTAVAECDESAALVSFLLRRLGVSSVGLFWPQSNHTVAVWKTRDRRGGEARIVLPTSQIFLEPEDGLDTRHFDPGRQKTIHEYRRLDAKGTEAISPALGRFMLEQVRRYAAASDAVQRSLRALRARFMAGQSHRVLETDRKALATRLRAAGAPDADLAAVGAFADELTGH